MSVETFREAASILQEADVSEIVTSLAIGIAKAQEALDNNSIKQLLVLADPANGVGGKSLLELGFTPAFYHFQHADISASISLRMKLRTEQEIAVAASLYFEKQKGYSKEKLDFLLATQSASHKKGFRSSREFVVDISEDKSVEIQNSERSLDQSVGFVSRVEKLKAEMRAQEGIDRASSEFQSVNMLELTAPVPPGVFFSNSCGVMTLVLDKVEADYGVLKVSGYPLTADTIDLSGSHDFDLVAGFETTLGNADVAIAGGTTFAFKGNQLFQMNGTNVESKPLEIRFESDSDRIDFAYSSSDLDFGELRALTRVLRGDPSLKVRIEGHTDGVGQTNYNLYLSKRRARALRCWMLAYGVGEEQVLIDAKGESQAVDGVDDPARRIATVELLSDKDYFYLEGGNFVENDASATSSTAEWVAKEGAVNPFSSLTLGTGPDAVTVNISSWNIDSISGPNYEFELHNHVYYLAHKKSQVKFAVYSETESELDISESSSYSGSGSGSDYSYLIDESQSSSSVLKKDAEKIDNPSTFAVGASISARASRQFEMSMEGNSSVSARLVALPAPPEFLDEIKSYFS